MILDSENLDIFKACLEKWGADSQFFMLVEECAEVIQAVNKVMRNQPLAINHLIGEVADLDLMLNQIKFWIRENDLEAQYDTERQIKIERLLRLLDEN